VIGNNAWTAWIGELVPGAIRGRFFSRRTVYISVASTVASLAAAEALDRLGPRGWQWDLRSAGWRRSPASPACLSLYLLHRQHDPARAPRC
jgi:hypothetical protein